MYLQYKLSQKKLTMLSIEQGTDSNTNQPTWFKVDGRAACLAARCYTYLLTNYSKEFEIVETNDS
jgi:hypothetical protein